MHLVKSDQEVRVRTISKAMAVVGHLKWTCEDAVSVAGPIQETCLRGPGSLFDTSGILEHQIFRFGKMILRDRCSTSFDLAPLSHGRRNTLDAWTGKIAKRIGTRPSATIEEV